MREQMRRSFERRKELERLRDERWAHYYSDPKPQTLSFFALPRELRDQVYHHLWRLLKPCVFQSVPHGDSQLLLELRYEGHYDISSMHGQREDWPGTSSRFPSAILASKPFLHEALEQYLRKAEWYVYRPYYSRTAKSWDFASLGIATAKTPHRLTVDAANLSHLYEPRPSHPTGDFHRDAIEETAQLLRNWQSAHRGEDSEPRIRCLRVFGHTYDMPSSLVGQWAQAPHVARNLWRFFEGIEIPRFQVDMHCESGLRFQSYVVTGRGESEELRVKMVEEWRRRRDSVAEPFRYWRVDGA